MHCGGVEDRRPSSSQRPQTRADSHRKTSDGPRCAEEQRLIHRIASRVLDVQYRRRVLSVLVVIGAIGIASWAFVLVREVLSWSFVRTCDVTDGVEILADAGIAPAGMEVTWSCTQTSEGWMDDSSWREVVAFASEEQARRALARAGIDPDRPPSSPAASGLPAESARDAPFDIEYTERTEFIVGTGSVTHRLRANDSEVVEVDGRPWLRVVEWGPASDGDGLLIYVRLVQHDGRAR
jgi:hypothetical protein